MDADQHERIRLLGEELDQIIPREGAVVKMLVEGGGPDESRMVGNEHGYLRLAIELLQGVMRADMTPSGKTYLLNIDWGYLEDDSSDVSFDEFILDPSLTKEAATELTRFQKAANKTVEFALTGLLLLLLAAVIVGLMTIIDWVTHLLSSL